jgi:hypothetical protein
VTASGGTSGGAVMDPFCRLALIHPLGAGVPAYGWSDGRTAIPDIDSCLNGMTGERSLRLSSQAPCGGDDVVMRTARYLRNCKLFDGH